MEVVSGAGKERQLCFTNVEEGIFSLSHAHAHRHTHTDTHNCEAESPLRCPHLYTYSDTSLSHPTTQVWQPPHLPFFP